MSESENSKSITITIAAVLGGWETTVVLVYCLGRRRRCKVTQLNSNVPSIFDLSPSEKLQLVEDLWDDLAATPDAIAVHAWQKEELDRRKANLLKNPASGLSWQEFQRRVRSRHDR